MLSLFILALPGYANAQTQMPAKAGHPSSSVDATTQPHNRPKNKEVEGETFVKNGGKSSETNVPRKVVAPNVDLKKVAPPPEALPVLSSSRKDTVTAIDSATETSVPSEAKPAMKVESVFSNSELNSFMPAQSNDLETVMKEGVSAGTMSESGSVNSKEGEAVASTVAEPFFILGAEVPPGVSTRLGWAPGIAIAGLATPVPVLVINGEKPGKTFCLMAAIHGDELNGIEVVRRVIYEINPKKLNGRVIGVPIVNLQGFQRNSRYLADRRDLNRYFPGQPQGSLASRIAYSLFNEVISHCDALIDLHTGSLRRNNLPQLRADMSNPLVVEFTEFFDDLVVVHSTGSEGMLRWAASERNIPTVTLEIGESNRLQEKQVHVGVKSINSLLDRMGMYKRFFIWGDPEPVYYQSTWIRAEQGGILFSTASLGNKVKKGDVLGNVTDPITNEVSNIVAPSNGRIIGMAVNQVVMPGFAAYHLGIESSEKEVATAATKQKEEAYMGDVENQPE